MSAGGWREEPDGSVSLTQAPRMLDKTECLGRTSSHPSYFFSLLLYMYLLDHLSIGTFY